jgi:hypothetical protein
LRAHAGEVDRGFAVHAGRAGHVAVELVARHRTPAIVFPCGVRCCFLGLSVIVTVRKFV